MTLHEFDGSLLIQSMVPTQQPQLYYTSQTNGGAGWFLINAHTHTDSLKEFLSIHLHMYLDINLYM